MRKPSLFSIMIVCFCCLCGIAISIELPALPRKHTVSTAELTAAPLPSAAMHDTPEQELLLTFAGDLMAHTVNFNMKQYDLIYKDVENILHSDDLSFVNVETPVCDTLPCSTYPCFNVHTDYLRAAVTAGFDVFSFANNHTNDHGVIGINGTLAAVRTVQQEREAAAIPPRLLAYSGLKEQVGEPLKITQISYKGWNILFCAATEILNSYDSSKDRLYYSPPTKKGRAALLRTIQEARKQYPCDLFILSLHLNEPEYIRTVSQRKKAWFLQLGEAGADIVWAHHPHVMQPWETITVKRPASLSYTAQYHSALSDTILQDINTILTATITGNTIQTHREPSPTKPPLKLMEQRSVFCMYSMGNFISGQRWHVNYAEPTYYREYTGDAVLLQLQCRRSSPAGGVTFTVSPILITQYNEPSYPVVKQFTPAWIQTLNGKEQQYFRRRFALMKEYLPF